MDLGDLERWWQDSGIAIWSFVLFGCFLLNVILFLAFLIRPGLRTISNRFVMNLTVSNLLICGLLNLLLIMDASPTSEPDSSVFSAEKICAISEGATALMTTSSVLSVFLIAIDQYFAVVDPLRYRAKVDKVKSEILICSVWLISSMFAIMAFLNPNPRSLWLSCNLRSMPATTDLTFNNSSTDVQSNLSVAIIENNTTSTTTTITDIEMEWIEYGDDNISNEMPMTYGMIYAILHSLTAYLLPFACVCWIYVKIYSAAHRNSERTRRTGSRPILSSASFCEDSKSQQHLQQQQQQQLQQQQLQQQQHQQMDNLLDDFRRIPKISSLSSIDETSETTQPAAGSQIPRGRSFSSVSEIHSLHVSPSPPTNNNNNEDSSSGGDGSVVFTVGGMDADECSHIEENETNKSNGHINSITPAISIEKIDLTDNEEPRLYSDHTKYDHLVKNHYLDRPEDIRQKSPHNLMYDQMLIRESKRGSWLNNDNVITDLRNSDTEEDETSECFRSTNSVFNEQKSTYLSPYSAYETIVNRNEQNDDAEINDIYVAPSSRINDRLIRTKERRNVVGESKVNEFERLKNEKHYNEGGGRGVGGVTSDCDLTEVIVDGNCEVYNVENTGRSREIVVNGTNNNETSACLLTPIVTITPAPNKNTLHRVSSVRSTSSYINSLKYRISNGSLFRYREETRAARISALVIVMGLICWSPYEILLLLKNLPPYNNYKIAHEYDVTVLCFLVLAAYVSPLLFGYRSKRVKRELRKFFCFKKELSYKNNRSLMAKKVLKRRHSNTFSHLELDNRYNIFNCVYGRNRWPKEKVQFVQVPDTALAVETCRSSFSSGASTQISTTSTDDC
ncbi:uncharacterized protein LOC122521356 [Polistes fuscatus]|uniref:uncharacterized protein LOC122521356 n=1 Tax=Polistes fuscatus TaxID=30207 RepID=UPI001CAA3F14|nr:uncharacterized protein LOC122521356 [Polistes fuscatus]XP_043497948.1 uncharacterized protein LOC122521356 [Polistes fuscatus]XP_043497949.1 uncharacterized protein LOC122521356 [Polistes fuscatus]XP_043497950.1 uncharacterized protein LOC122521356 [Polistes fuscatus]